MPIPHQPNGGQSALEKYAIEQRNKLIPKNLYNNESDSNNYGPTHTRAIADQKTPHYGKGTGTFLDIYNYNGGSDWDIFGNQANSIGSGRNPAFANNYGTWGYDNGHYYKKPDMDKNVGQVVIDG